MVAALLVTALFTAAFGVAWRIAPVYGPPGGVVWNVPSGPTPTLQAALAVAANNDEIHVAVGYFGVLAGPVNIWQNNLWIIGGPPQFGPAPVIDLAGSTITITGTGVFMWGLNIIDTVGTPVGIQLVPPSGNCIIRNNTIGGPAIGWVGIEVWTANNRIELNNMSWWEVCIDLVSPGSTGNVVAGNTFGQNAAVMYGIGVQVSQGAGFNEVYYNNLWWPGVAELWDANPGGSPPNAFDDTWWSLGGAIWGPSGGPSLNKGNFEATWAIPPPYAVPPGTNGYMDFWPWVVPWVQWQGDLNLDGRTNIIDIVMVALTFNWVWCQLLWDPRADVDGNGVVNIVDIVIVALNFGTADP